MYGDWEGAIYNYQYRLPSEEKNKIKFQALE
jgi:predicted secreted acid phosphatase